MVKYVVLILGLLIVCHRESVSQTNGGSTYSIFNLGDLRSGTTAAGVSRAGIETAVPSPTTINSNNPACWSDLHYVFIQAAMSFDQYNVSNSGSSLSQNMTKLQDFAFAFPYSSSFGGTAVFGIRPYTTVNYRTLLRSNVRTVDTNSAMATIVYSGSGGMSVMELGSSFKPFNGVVLGVSALRYFGSVYEQDEVGFDNSSLNPAVYRTNDLYSGIGGKVGGLVELFDGSFRVGAVYQTSATVTRERTQSSAYLDNGVEYIDTTQHSESDITIPSRLSFGASFKTGRIQISGEGNFQSWNTTTFNNTRSMNRYAVGFDKLPTESVNASGLDRWSFRLGAYLEQTYYQVNGTGIDQLGLTTGFTLPLTSPNPLNSSTAIDVGLEVGQRGTTDNGLTKEQFFKITIGLSLNELWFQRSTR